MIKVILFLCILANTIYANTQNIKELQIAFQKNVIEINVFRKRYQKYITAKCGDNLECIKSKINRLKSWDTVQNDSPLKYMFDKKKSIVKYDDTYWNQLLNKLKSKQIDLNSTQFVSIIDLENQFYILTLWDKDTEQFNYIGKDLISSGNMHRESEIKFGEDHYLKTPAGVFESQIGWRSDGKYSDDNITQGYGVKNRYVFYFGKQDTIRYNTFDKEKNKIYDPDKWNLITDKLDFAVHSHKSSKPMGEPNSHGCVRMSDELNRFLDNNLVLHKNMFIEDKWLNKYTKSPDNPKNYKFAGKYLIVLDNI
ncbi:MAG: L,D-transpeptidase [Campylobacterota bacterium]|nr:L,D-transpeptidase [Campylobacterota bacterium]